MSTTLTPEMAAALAQAEAVLEHGIDNAGVPLAKPVLRSIALGTVSWLSTAPFDLPRKEGHREAGVGQTKGDGLEAAGVLEAYAVSSRIRITSRSIARYRLANAILSHPLDGPRPRIRLPRARFKPQRRKPTEAELEGLREGNRQRSEAKQRRVLEEARKREVRTARV